MAKRNHPRRGSMAFSPRTRSPRHFAHVNAWPESDASEVRVQGFAGWKAGMTHVLSRDLNPRSTTAGQEVRVPVTVVEVPKMRILGVRGYTMTPYGKQAAGEAWLSSEDIKEAFPEVFNRISTRKVHDTDTHFANLEEADQDTIERLKATIEAERAGACSSMPMYCEAIDGGKYFNPPTFLSDDDEPGSANEHSADPEYSDMYKRDRQLGKSRVLAKACARKWKISIKAGGSSTRTRIFRAEEKPRTEGEPALVIETQ